MATLLRGPSYCHLVHYDTVAEYRDHFEIQYCSTPLYTFDSIAVGFVPSLGGHPKPAIDGQLKTGHSGSG